MNDNFFIYLIICFSLSFLIGIERQYRRRVVGLRTSILVSIGSFLFVSFTFSVGAADVSRIASQVVAGIGFLGAGVILKEGTRVKGLTTAATLWCDAAIGILCAGGAIKEAFLGTVVILFANIVLRYINELINHLNENKNTKQTYKLIIKTKKEEVSKIQKNLIKVLDDLNSKSSYSIQNSQVYSTLTYNFTIIRKDWHKIDDLVNNLNQNYELQSITLNKVKELKIENLEEL